jgi:hypothetical protein
MALAGRLGVTVRRSSRSTRSSLTLLSTPPEEGPTGTELVEKLGRPADTPCPDADSTLLARYGSGTKPPDTSSVDRGSDIGTSEVEDGSYGSFVAFDVDEPKGVVEGEHTRCQPENDRGVSAHDGIEIATIMQAHL